MEGVSTRPLERRAEGISRAGSVPGPIARSGEGRVRIGATTLRKIAPSTSGGAEPMSSRRTTPMSRLATTRSRVTRGTRDV